MAERFRAWQRPQVSERATGPMIHARRSAELVIQLSDGAGGDQAAAPFLLAGPQDVLSVSPAAIVGRKPAPGTQDAEITRVAHVELAEPDLPWRYSPDGATPVGGVKPWLVLVVGETGVEVMLAENNTAMLAGAVFAAHDLSTSASWAHVHDIPGRSISRLLCPRQLTVGRDWTAALVPAWRVDGDVLVPAWDSGTVEVTLRCFESWQFRTIDEEDDFRIIAQRLNPLTTAESDALEASGFGRANVAFASLGAPQVLPPLSGALGVRGAAPTSAVTDAVAGRTSSLASITSLEGRWVLGLPRYDEPWAPQPAPDPVGWRRQLHDDPRHRGVAGLGAWAAVAWQDRIADGATVQTGALAQLAERVRHLGIGLRSARSQWSRRVLPIRVGPDGQRQEPDHLTALAVLGPMLGRLPTSPTTSALDDLERRTPWLVPALFTSAARRMLRPRSPLARAAASGASRLPALIEAAATSCPAEPPALPGQDDVSSLVGDDGTVSAAADRLAENAAAVVERLYAAHPEEVGFDHEGLRQGLDRPTIVDAFAAIAGRRPDDDGRRPEPLCRPVEDLGLVAVSICGAIDPTVQRPVVIDRVFDGVTGLREPILAAPDLALELDIPLWSFLRENSPDWLLPGAGSFPLDRVTALETRPEFVEAFLIGANAQSLRELRWRNVAITAGWTPLRRFWQRIEDDGSKPATDIEPVLDIGLPPAPGAPTWSDATLLGDDAHQSGPLGAMLVVLLHTELFRRYPATQVYLVPNHGGPTPWAGDPPDAEDPATPRTHPNLTGTLHPELVFFGFPVPPAAASDHWLVLEEPPPGFRFLAPNHAVAPIEPEFDGAVHAVRTLSPRIRAFFGNLL